MHALSMPSLFMRPCQAACLAALLGLSQIPQTAQAGNGEVVLRGSLDGKDHQRYRLLPFQVGEGVGRITLELDYSGREDKTTLDLGLMDPNGIRGWSGGNKRQFTISPSDATPSYLPGALPPGTWHVLLGIPNIRPDSHADYTARILSTAAATPEGLPASLAATLKHEAGWYRGDLHTHTGHSDASCASQSGQRVPCPLFLTAQQATRHGLDFVAITDHNTSSHFHDIRGLQPYFDQLLLLTGIEVTTFQGHMNVFGLQTGIDFRVGSATVPDLNALLAEAERRGVLASINHPALPSDERCMGCGWSPKTAVDMGRIGAVEVVNGGDAGTPVSGIAFWHEQLSAGRRMTGIGGSDNHDALLETSRFGASRIGSPTTVVHAQSLSQAQILDGIRSGRVYIDVTGSGNRHLESTVQPQGAAAIAHMGDNVMLAAGETLVIRNEVIDGPGSRLELLLDGTLIASAPITAMEGAMETIESQWRSDGQRHWLRADVRGPDGALHLVGNPIYINFDDGQSDHRTVQNAQTPRQRSRQIPNTAAEP